MKNLFCFVFFGLLYPGIGFAQAKFTPEMAYEGYKAVKNLQGTETPPFSAMAINGSEVNIKQYRDSVIVLSVWNVNCAPCINELNSFKELKKTYSGKKIVFLALDPIDSLSDIKAFLRKHKCDFEILYKPASTIISDYKIAAYPTNYVIDRTGMIRYARMGYFENGVQIINAAVKPYL